MNSKDKYEGYWEDLRLVGVRPSKRQLNYQELEYYGFVHFGINTFTGREWGTGQESPEWFNPTSLDADQWVETAKRGGMRGLILTCKHHDGFCLWPSLYTEHSIKNSPYKGGRGDIVKEVSEACKEAGIRFGIYLSPWDLNHPSYGKGEEYDLYYLNQLTELLTGYGDVFAVWLDGACGEGKNGKKQIYNWEKYYAKVRELQPKACIAVSGPDIRWCGNEAGDTRSSEWSVVPKELSDTEKIASESQQEEGARFREKPLSVQDRNLGGRDVVEAKKELIWYPAEVDVSIRPGWFYHEEEDDRVKSFEELKEIYLRSVGGNCMLLLNLPPTKEGLIHQKDVQILEQLGAFIENSFKENLATEADIVSFPLKDAEGREIKNLLEDEGERIFCNPEGKQKLEISFIWQEEKRLQYLVLQEKIACSQRVEAFEISYLKENLWRLLTKGTTIGYKRIIPLGGISAKAIKVCITDARVAPILSRIGIY